MTSVKKDNPPTPPNQAGKESGPGGLEDGSVLSTLPSPWLVLRAGCPQPQGSLAQE